MDREEAWAKIKELCPDIKEDKKLAWQIPQSGEWVLSNITCQRIAAYHKILVTYEQPIEIMGNIVIKATATNTLSGLKVESFGESNKDNTRIRYPISIAEKRAHDRVVLKAVDIYTTFYSESEDSPDYNLRKPKTKEE
tara:strand:+ start:76 stop:489 length:414 start_codon:yes stop_codon:yes gene_type:complete